MTPRTRRSLTLIGISLALATVAALLAGRWMTSRAAAVDAARPQAVRLVAAATDIPFGTAIESRHLKTLAVLASNRPGGSYTNTDAVLGKVPKTDVFAGELLLADRLVVPGEGSTLAAVVSPTMRAVTVRVDDVVGVGGFLLPGNRVDVIAARENDGRAEAETILERIKVLAVDQQASADRSLPVVVRAVTLEVSPEGAEAIARARQQGVLQLTLRNPSDDSSHRESAPPSTTPAALMTVSTIPTPTTLAVTADGMPLRPAPRQRATPRDTGSVVTVIRGTTQTSQSVADPRPIE